jgi:hypothetical protein
MSEETKLSIHWRVVSYISPKAAEWVKQTGGQVMSLSGGPAPLVAVGIPYNPEGSWGWSHGQRQHREGLEFWNLGELQVPATGMTLQYRDKTGESIGEYASVTDTYFIMPDEEFDKNTGQAKEQPEEEEDIPEHTNIDWGNIDDHPF